jgi:hypothetical protein
VAEEFLEGCPDCGADVVPDPDDPEMVECSDRLCGWRP